MSVYVLQLPIITEQFICVGADYQHYQRILLLVSDKVVSQRCHEVKSYASEGQVHAIVFISICHFYWSTSFYLRQLGPTWSQSARGNILPEAWVHAFPLYCR